MTPQEILDAIALSASQGDTVIVNVEHTEDIFNVVYATIEGNESITELRTWTDDGDTTLIDGRFGDRNFSIRVLSTEKE